MIEGFVACLVGGGCILVVVRGIGGLGYLGFLRLDRILVVDVIRGVLVLVGNRFLGCSFDVLVVVIRCCCYYPFFICIFGSIF